MPPRTTSFGRTGVPDASLIQTASTPFDGPERQVIDQQITDIQKALAAILVNGGVGTYAKIDANSPTIAKGDVLCRSASALGTWTLATASALAAVGGIPAGIALSAAAPNSRCPVILAGVIDPAITGLAASSGFCRVSSAGRCENVAGYSPGDYALGAIDSKGWLSLVLGGGPVQTGAAPITTTDDTPTVLSTIPFSDDAAATTTFEVLAVAASVGTYQSFSAGGIIATSGGVLQAAAGTPTVNSFWSADPDPSPSFTIEYDSAAKVLKVVGTGLAATTIRWRVRFSPLTLLDLT